MIDPARLVFVGGLHRSGTTALARALGEHDEVSGLTGTPAKEDEGQHLQEVYPPANSFGGAGRFAWEDQAHLTEQSPLVTRQAAQDLMDAWGPYWDLSRHLLVEKSPPNLLMTRFLQALYPGSATVVVVRHPIVVALSTKKWARGTSLARLVEHNVRAYEIFAADSAHLERVHVLRYEELVTSPESVLGAVGEFLGLEGPMPTSAIRGGHSSQYEDMWRAYGEGSFLRRRRRTAIEDSVGASLARFGYRTDDLSAADPWAGLP